MEMQVVRLAGSLLEPQKTLNRPNIAPYATEAKRDGKERARRVFGLLCLFIITFNLSFNYWIKRLESEKEDGLRIAMENFISYNPSRVNVVGFMDENVNDEEYIVIEYKGKFLGYDKNGEPKYNLPNANYLYLKRSDYKLGE